MKRYDFYGLSVDSFTIEELTNKIVHSIYHKKSMILYGHALWSIPMMYKYPEIYKKGNNADILVTDGHPFFVLCKYFKKIPLEVEISIPQSVYMVLDLANKMNLNIYLLGSDEITNQLACKNISNDYVNIGECFGHNGYFSNEEYQSIISDINSKNIDILLIGISSPKKEILSMEWRDTLNIGIIIPCGGMIDVLSGKTKLTPKLIKSLGLASFYRVLQEPQRLFRRYSFIYGFIFFRFLPVFIWQVFILRNKKFSIPKYYKYD